MTLRPFFPYYGSKWSLGRQYPAPRHDRIIEPFAGSACYSLHHHTRDVVLIERDPVIAELWRWLIRVTPAEVLALPDLEPGQSTDDLDVCPAARSLIGAWLGQASSSGPAKRPYGYAKDVVCGGRCTGESRSHTWCSKVRHRIARQLEAIRHWTVLEGDAMRGAVYRAMERDIGLPAAATWFVDPPYAGRPGSHYRYGSKDIDYSELAAWATALPGQVVVCEQLGADWLPFERLGRVQGQRGANTEVVWCSDRRDSPSWLQPGLFAATGT